MSYSINETHDPQLRSWVESANDPQTDFPIQNLPFCIFSRKRPHFGELPRPGVAIGDQILDLAACADAEVFEGVVEEATGCLNDMTLYELMSWGPEVSSSLRSQLIELLRADSPKAKKNRQKIGQALIRYSDAQLSLPTAIGDYTDFYASVYHATNIGKMFRPDNPLLPNYKWVPIGYHGRASSIVVSDTPVRRPVGQMEGEGGAPAFGSSKVLDYELEVGCFIGAGNEQGHPIKIAAAEDHIFGLCLVNDWSARDVQRWEYQPLGPFLSKSFATTISPWIVTMEALAPFRAAAFARPAGDPQPLPYLNAPENRAHGGFDIKLEVLITTVQMREQGLAPHRLSESNTKDLYWTFAQLLTHHTSNGCNLRPGDLLASGTVSGATKDSQGSLIELTARGTEPINLPSGEERRFLQDGDEVILRGYCEREGFRRLGFGECRSTILSALT